MNSHYYTDNYPIMPFLYWAQLYTANPDPNPTYYHKEPSEIVTEQPIVKIQKLEETIPTSLIVRNPKPAKRPSKKNRKSRKIKKRDMSFSGKSQKQNRNYTSILCRTFLMHLAQWPHLKSLVNSIISHFAISFSFETFLKTFDSLFDLKKCYVRKELIEGVCDGTVGGKQFAVVFRVLFRRFLKLEIFPCIFKSSKLTKKVKSKESKFGRKVYETFFQRRKGEGNQGDAQRVENQKKALQKRGSEIEVKKEEGEAEVKKEE